jgi:hypothetical protein
LYYYRRNLFSKEPVKTHAKRYVWKLNDPSVAVDPPSKKKPSKKGILFSRSFECSFHPIVASKDSKTISSNMDNSIHSDSSTQMSKSDNEAATPSQPSTPTTPSISMITPIIKKEKKVSSEKKTKKLSVQTIPASPQISGGAIAESPSIQSPMNSDSNSSSLELNGKKKKRKRTSTTPSSSMDEKKVLANGTSPAPEETNARLFRF